MLELRNVSPLAVPSFAARAGSASQADLDSEVAARRAGDRFQISSSAVDGTGSAITATVSGLVAYAVGTRISIFLPFDLGTNATLDVNGLGAKQIWRNTDERIRAHDLKAHRLYDLTLRGSADLIWYVENPNIFDEIDERIAGDRFVIPTDQVSGTSTAIIASTETPNELNFITSGTRIGLALPFDCGDSPTLDLNDTGPLALLRKFGEAIKAGDLKEDELHLFQARGSPRSWVYEGPAFAMIEESLAAGRFVVSSANVTGTPTNMVATADGLTLIKVGTRIGLVLPFDCGDNPVININGLGNKALLRKSAENLRAGDIKAGELHDFTARGGGPDWYYEGPHFASNVSAEDAIDSVSFAQPGDTPSRWTNSLAGGHPSIAPQAPYPVVVDSEGAAMRITGHGILAPKFYYMLELGQVWLVRWAGLRVANSVDPENDAINCAVAFYDNQKVQLPAPNDIVVFKSIAPPVAGGPWVEEATLSLGGGTDILVPSNARYWRPYGETFGSPPPVTDIRILGGWDITHGGGTGGGVEVLHAYQLLNNVAVTGAWTVVAGGQYAWSAAGGFGGATLTLQYLGADGVTPVDVVQLTSTGTYHDPLDIGEGTQCRVKVAGGTPSGLFSDLRQIQ